MRSGVGRRIIGARQDKRCHIGIAAASALALAAAACSGDERPTASTAAAPTATVAFESIAGPPLGVFEGLVRALSEEAEARQIAVVSRRSTPHYRVRAYLAMNGDERRPRIGWVWDIYDAEKRRTLRIAGEERGAPAGGDAWLAADDALLRRIAQAGLNRLAAYLGPSGQAPAPPSEREAKTVVAAVSATDVRPPFGGPVPVPPRRPHVTTSVAALPTPTFAIKKLAW
jgi:hypothetical protein